MLLTRILTGQEAGVGIGQVQHQPAHITDLLGYSTCMLEEYNKVTWQLQVPLHLYTSTIKLTKSKAAEFFYFFKISSSSNTADKPTGSS